MREIQPAAIEQAVYDLILDESGGFRDTGQDRNASRVHTVPCQMQN